MVDAPTPAPATPVAAPVKSKWASLTVWGGIVAVVSGTIAAVTGLIDSNFHTNLGSSQAITTVTSILGFIMTIIGRFNAVAPLV